MFLHVQIFLRMLHVVGTRASMTIHNVRVSQRDPQVGLPLPSRQNSAARLTLFVLVIITIDYGFPPSYEYVYSHEFRVPPTTRNLHACLHVGGSSRLVLN